MSTERFDIRHAPAPRESFRLLYISKSKFGGDWNSTAHTHSCTELFYCLSGEGQFYLSGQLYPVKPDDMIIVNPQVEHTELSLNASPWNTLYWALLASRSYLENQILPTLYSTAGKIGSGW